MIKKTVLCLTLSLTLSVLVSGTGHAAEIKSSTASAVSETKLQALPESETQLESQEVINGKMQEETQSESSEKSVQEPEIPVEDGWHDGIYYKGGFPYTGIEPADSKIYVFYDGLLQLDCFTTLSDGRCFYSDEEGCVVTGEKRIDGIWYYFDHDGVMATGETIQADRPNNTYYYDEYGHMMYDWQIINGKKCFFDRKTGVMQKNKEYKIDECWYYFKADGEMATGFTEQANRPENLYYYDDNGQMWHEEKRIEGKWYYFHAVTGVMETGWTRQKARPDNKYYYENNGQMCYGEKRIEDNWYYFNETTGVMETGWTRQKARPDSRYYYDKNGQMCYGEKRIDDIWYYFHPVTGVMQTGWTTQQGRPGNKYYYDKNGQMLYGAQTLNGKYYYFNTVTGVLEQEGRRYQNPSGYYQIQDSITLFGGDYELGIGYEGLKTAKVIRRLGLGNAIGMGGAYYGTTVRNAVIQYQRSHGLKGDGVVGRQTWFAMGFSEYEWNYLGAYVSPIRVDSTSTREDCIEAMISRAYDYLGDNYVIGASGAPGLGIDCSGLVMQALYAAGIDMSPINPVRHAHPGYEYESANIWYSSQFKHVSISQRQRGDIIIYTNSRGTSVIHSAIYLGDNQVIESWPNRVTVNNMVNGQHPYVLGVLRVFN